MGVNKNCVLSVDVELNFLYLLVLLACCQLMKLTELIFFLNSYTEQEGSKQLTC